MQKNFNFPWWVMSLVFEGVCNFLKFCKAFLKSFLLGSQIFADLKSEILIVYIVHLLT